MIAARVLYHVQMYRKVRRNVMLAPDGIRTHKFRMRSHAHKPWTTGPLKTQGYQTSPRNKDMKL